MKYVIINNSAGDIRLKKSDGFFRNCFCENDFAKINILIMAEKRVYLWQITVETCVNWLQIFQICHKTDMLDRCTTL